MNKKVKGRFRCIHCGDRFDLSPEEEKDYDEGDFAEPDCCDECMHTLCNGEYEEEWRGDADPGL